MAMELHLSGAFPSLGPGLSRLAAELQVELLSAAGAFGFEPTGEGRGCVLTGARMTITG